MELLNLDLGNSPNDGNGDDLRTGGQKINANFKSIEKTLDTLPIARVFDGTLVIPQTSLSTFKNVGDIVIGIIEGFMIVGVIKELPSLTTAPLTLDHIDVYIKARKL